MSNKFEIMCKESDKRGERNDCTVKALAIACRVSYQEAHDILAINGRQKGKGCRISIWLPAIKLLGCDYEITYKPKQKNGSGYTMKTIGKGFPRGYYLVQVSGHLAAMINGQVLDWTEGRQHRVVKVIKVTVPRGSRS